jgi:hypothetical protein
MGWIGVDLDGTLAHHESGAGDIGKPVPKMVARVKKWLSQAKDIRIFTARVAHDNDGSQRRMIQAWSEEHLGETLPITNKKDYAMLELWDDRAVQVRRNTGEPVDVLRRDRE